MAMPTGSDSGKLRIRIRAIGEMLVYNTVSLYCQFISKWRCRLVSVNGLTGSIDCVGYICLISKAVILGPKSGTIIERTDEKVTSKRMTGISLETLYRRWPDSSYQSARLSRYF